MREHGHQPPIPSDHAARERRLEMHHLQVIEGNPLTVEEIAMFETFEREGWSHERRLEHILAILLCNKLGVQVIGPIICENEKRPCAFYAGNR
jgi:hypothetical protein